jgi:hyperosmotically inducible periplasmic protein
MDKHVSAAVVAIGLAMSAGGVVPAAQRQEKATVEELRTELLQLPYYGVFDFLAFNYAKGTVTLMGYAYQPMLKKDAVRAAKRATGVDEVVDKIEELPVSAGDDEIRWQTYYAIYRDPFLSKYAPGGAGLWGHSHPFADLGFQPYGAGPFLGYEPAGDYPIHIVVKGGHTTLLGVVDSEADKNVAAMRARGVPGVFGVENELMVEKSN